MHPVELVITVGWLVFWVYWLAASASVKAAEAGSSRIRGGAVATVVVLFVLVRLSTTRWHAVVSSPWLKGIGVAIFVLGLALAVWARIYLGRNWGTPMSRKVDPELVTTGPYRRVRHPIYSGILAGMVGTAVALSWYGLIAAALAAAYFCYSAVREERYLAETFSQTYPGYKRSTKMLIPFVL
jgi:protein-S-isoprenylcysteine O-methyltransferase Ste14